MADPTTLEITETVIKIIGSILIPVVLFMVGRTFTNQRATADTQQAHISLLSSLADKLASENPKSRIIALHIIGHMRDQGKLPVELIDSIATIATIDDPDVAAAAMIALGKDIKITDNLLLSELFAPMKIHFDRTKEAFSGWTTFNVSIENKIKESNQTIRDLLINRRQLIPNELKEDASNLIAHYDAWLEEYDRVRPGGIRDKNERYVFVGPQGKGFPSGASDRFNDYYKKLLSKVSASK